MRPFVRHVGIVVNNLKESVFFWTKIMKFEVLSESEEKGKALDAILELKNVNLKTIKLCSDQGTLIELLKFYSHPGKPSWEGSTSSTGLTHIALTVKNLDKLIRDLKRENYRIHTSPKMSPDKKVKFTYCRGPENLIIELVQLN